ncbi:MAG TPA: hypothetical protein VJ969_09215, partial [Desulfopila sp.]|nr:hypothetical protein [Desulfopila sp.]
MDYQRTPRHISRLRSRAISQRLSCEKIFSVVVVFLLLTGTFPLLAVQNGHAAVEPSTEPRENLNMPWEYGEVIYRINPESNKQLYIIGISHRDSSTGANGSTTVKAQKEIYRIGEWLKKSAQMDLLLPEGYFNETECTDELSRPVMGAEGLAEQVIDSAQLEQKLAADAFTNAEMLLMEYLSFSACQVEDKAIYRAVRSSLDKLSSAGSRRGEFRKAIEEIRYLQEVRTAQLLQDIPDIIESQFDYGVIGKRSAMFTIGLNHIKHIFR